MTSWLQRKRKGELLDLAEQVDLPDADRMLKDDLVAALADYLDANENLYGKTAVFSDFYNRRGSSPVKRERVSPEVMAIPKAQARRRRTTLKSTLDSDEPTPDSKPTPDTKSLVARTPRTIEKAVERRVVSPLAHVSSQVDLPATPAQLAEVADQSIQTAKAKASELWERTRVEETIEYLRENASSVAFIQSLILFIEAAGLQWNTLSTFHAFTTQALPVIGTQNVHFPDLSFLLTSGFWAPATLWSLTNWVLPLLFSYFFNLSLRSNTRHKSPNRQYTVDPLTFNIARALLAYSAYAPLVAPAELVLEPGVVVERIPGWGPFSDATINTVRDNVPGKYLGIQIGSLIGVLYSLYDAALKK